MCFIIAFGGVLVSLFTRHMARTPHTATMVLRAPVGASKDESHLPGSSSPRDRDRVALPRSTQCSAFATPPRQRPQSSPLSPRVTAAGIIKGNPVTAVASGSLSAGVAARSPNHGLKPRASMGGFAQGSGEGAAKGVGGGGSNRRSEDKGVVAVDPEAEKRKAHQRLEQYRKAQEAAKDQAAQQEEQKRREEREQFTRAQQLKDRQREEIYSLNTLMRRTEEHRLQCYMQRKEAERVAGAGKVPGANDSLASPGQILADDTDDGGMSDGDDDDVSSPSFSSLADKRRGKGGAPAASRLGQGASTATSTGHVLRETSYLAV
eukprot:jgi/Mesvir1/5973/Mv00727-RA.1